MDDIERQAMQEVGLDPDDWKVQLGQVRVRLLLAELRTAVIPPRYPWPVE
ncbi:hypothetical protein [Nocardia thailandica]|nr:hypothetical protein [Nocardia thailandica]